MHKRGAAARVQALVRTHHGLPDAALVPRALRPPGEDEPVAGSQWSRDGIRRR